MTVDQLRGGGPKNEPSSKVAELVADNLIDAETSTKDIFKAFGKAKASTTSSSVEENANKGYTLPSKEELAKMPTNDLEAFIQAVTDAKRDAELFLQNRVPANDSHKLAA
jgi:hypothetical protein